MRFLVDESTGPSVAQWLHSQGHDVFSVYEQARGMADDAVLEKALVEDRVLITNDKDFGEKVYRERRLHRGIVLLRLEDERAAHKIEMLRRLLAQHESQLRDSFVVVTETRARFARG
jgi:predicted nuclease of predicted toxin-antitoxin system